MTHIKPFFFAVLTLFLSACSTSFPLFTPHKWNIVFVQSTPYLVPYGAKFSNQKVSNEVTIKDYQANGIPCRKGSITWTDSSTAQDLKETYRIDGADAFSYAYQQAIRNHKMGCSQPLSHSEYEYYRSQYGL